MKQTSTIYWSLVGSLIYLTNTRSDIVHVVSIVSRFMSELSELHFTAAKRILRYVNGMLNFCMVYKVESDCNFIGYIQSDWVGSIDDWKSTRKKNRAVLFICLLPLNTK